MVSVCEGLELAADSRARLQLADIESLRHHFRRVLEQERSTTARDAGSSSDLHATESLVLRRDFVALVKLFRDLLFETSRLRSLINRVQLEPHLAANLRELDLVNVIDVERAPKSSGGLLAPFSRLFGAALSAEPEPAPPTKTPTTLRPPPKRSGSSAVSSTAVSVEFGSGAVRRAVATGGEGGGAGEASPDVGAPKDSPQTSTVGRKTGSQVKRDLNSIFAGASSGTRSASGGDWVVLPSAAPSSNPFGRLLAHYRPALSSTTNAVLDSIPHAPAADTGYQPTLLERQLRPRGLSDSSIRSTFVAHANPHHRIISPATLALSSETTKAASMPILVSAAASETGSAVGSPSAHGSLAPPPRADLRHQLSSSLLATSPLNRKPSSAKLKSKRSVSQLRSVSGPTLSLPSSPPPSLPTSPISSAASLSTSPAPVPISIFSPASHLPSHLHPATAPSSLAVSGSLFGNLTTWASKATGLSGPEMEDGEPAGKTRPARATAAAVPPPGAAERTRKDFS